MSMQPNLIAPPPWKLTGDGLVLVYRFSGTFNQKYAFLADYQRQGYKGWIGAVILADYKSSDVGPYRELLFIPGLFNLDGKITFSISKIYVSTYDSLWNGVENWGIPKELADFNIADHTDGSRIYEVGMRGNPFFEARVKPWRFGFPVSTRLLPWLQIIQQLRGQWLLTRPELSGKAQLSSLKDISVNSSFFPPINQVKPLAVLSVKDFLMCFPVPQVR